MQKNLGSSLALHVCFVVHCNKAFADYENSYNSFAIAGSNATYDYIVIGGGTAGNVIVARLAESPDVTVDVV
jgi:hypothetical protein